MINFDEKDWQIRNLLIRTKLAGKQVASNTQRVVLNCVRVVYYSGK